jgi:hypothetical protein
MAILTYVLYPTVCILCLPHIHSYVPRSEAVNDSVLET